MDGVIVDGAGMSAAEQELVAGALAGTGAPVDPAGWVVEDGGSSHRVVLSADVAVRVARHAGAAAELERNTARVDALPPLPFALPRSLGPVVTGSLGAAVATRRVPGDPSPTAVDPASLATVLDALAGVDWEPLADLLTEPLAYGGGARWREFQQAEVLPRLPARVRDSARRVVDALAAAETGPIGLVHGDLAGANLRWLDGRVVGLIDWDLATAYDPALDLACLAEWHGWDTTSRLADAATVTRARLHQDCFALHHVAHVIITRGPADETVTEAVDRATARLDGWGGPPARNL